MTHGERIEELIKAITEKLIDEVGSCGAMEVDWPQLSSGVDALIKLLVSRESIEI